MDKNNQEVDLFAYKLDYETAGRWDGNIGKQTWNNTSNQVRSYTFAYDYAKRLKSGTYSGVGAENYSLTNVNYDKNGNILNLVRNGNLGSSFGVMDNLTYTYTGNKLYKVEDAVSGDYTVDFVNRNAGTNDYDYYSDGSLKKDLNKEITQIDYDPFLKLPKQITLTNNRWIKITYASDGRVLKRTYSTGEYWEYDGALVHKNGQPYQLATPEGRATYASGVWTYEYFIQDHLGNTRVSFKANGSTPQVTDYTNYDPWGIELNGTGLNNTVENRFKYQSKESLTLFGLSGINDFGARYYDKTVGRWWGVDAMSEKYFALTSYNYVAGNPILYTDSDGRDINFIQASETTDKKTGITTVTYKINVRMSIMNSSSMRGNDFQKAVINFTNQLTRALSGVFNAGEKNKIVFQAGKIDVKTVNSMSEVKNSDHLMVIVDDVTGKSAKGGEAGGLAEIGGKIAYVEYKNSSNLPFLNELMIHEFGHNMGLAHNWESGYKEDDGSMNYMSYSNYKTQFVGVQLNQSYLKWELGQLNTGQNYDIAKDYISTGFTTQQMPLNYNVNKGSKIPKRLKN